jgi:hypothetical protein
LAEGLLEACFSDPNNHVAKFFCTKVSLNGPKFGQKLNFRVLKVSGQNYQGLNAFSKAETFMFQKEPKKPKAKISGLEGFPKAILSDTKLMV